MRTQPVVFHWREVELVDADGVATKAMAMVPLPRYAGVAKRQFHDGEDYPLQIVEERSMASHNEYFASIHEAFHNLPENIAARFPSPEHLRAWALCQCGYCDEDEFSFDDEKDAARLARWIRTDAPFAQIHRRGRTIIVRRPKSQSMAAMKKDAFEASKRDVRDLLSSMIGVRRSELAKNAGRAA